MKPHFKKSFTNGEAGGNLCKKHKKTFFMTVKGREKGDIMRTHKIKLRLDEVNEFVSAASKCDFDIDISYNSVVVDAKSIVGVLGLDLSKVLTVSCNGYDPEFEKYMNRFALAG